MRPLDQVFAALERSTFRLRFRLQPPERAYLLDRGIDAVTAHAQQFVAARLAPAAPANDGRQTPFRGHPVFVAQHATATCCRGCLRKWHAIDAGRALSVDEQRHVVAALRRWLLAAVPQAAAVGAGTDAAASRRPPSPAAHRRSEELLMAQPDKNRTGIPSDVHRNLNRDRKLDRHQRDNPDAIEGLDNGAEEPAANEGGGEAGNRQSAVSERANDKTETDKTDTDRPGGASSDRRR